MVADNNWRILKKVSFNAGRESTVQLDCILSSVLLHVFILHFVFHDVEDRMKVYLSHFTMEVEKIAVILKGRICFCEVDGVV